MQKEKKITFLGLIINSRLRKNVDPIHYDERFSNDKFGILVTVDSDDFEQVEHILRDFGSEELKLNGEVLEEKPVDVTEVSKNFKSLYSFVVYPAGFIFSDSLMIKEDNGRYDIEFKWYLGSE